MAVTDWVLLVVLLFSMALGAWRGLVYEVLVVLGWAVSFYVAQWFAPEVATRLPLQSAGEPLSYAAAFVLVFIAAVFVAGLLAFLVKKLVEAMGLRQGNIGRDGARAITHLVAAQAVEQPFA